MYKGAAPWETTESYKTEIMNIILLVATVLGGAFGTHDRLADLKVQTVSIEVRNK